MIRQRRLRKSENIREMLAEVSLSKSQLISPIFIMEKENWLKEIPSMPNIYQYSPDRAMRHLEEMVDGGITNFILFGIPKNKDFEGNNASNPDGVVPRVLQLAKDQFGDSISLYADVCLCEYTTHGHCGIPTEDGSIQNDLSLKKLADIALLYAEAGADWVAPSSMMDNRVISIRERLDEAGLKNTSILSYSAKFASNYYGPFRDAAESSPKSRDRKTYQIDYRGTRQALRELETDEIQGVDAIMVKPALAYLDIIQLARMQSNLPIFAYNVSGEYSITKLGARQGYYDEKKMVLENLIAMRRAGTDAILTYHAVDIVKNRWF